MNSFKCLSSHLQSPFSTPIWHNDRIGSPFYGLMHDSGSNSGLRIPNGFEDQIIRRPEVKTCCSGSYLEYLSGRLSTRGQTLARGSTLLTNGPHLLVFNLRWSFIPTLSDDSDGVGKQLPIDSLITRVALDTYLDFASCMPIIVDRQTLTLFWPLS